MEITADPMITPSIEEDSPCYMEPDHDERSLDDTRQSSLDNRDRIDRTKDIALSAIEFAASIYGISHTLNSTPSVNEHVFTAIDEYNEDDRF